MVNYCLQLMILRKVGNTEQIIVHKMVNDLRKKGNMSNNKIDS